MTLHIKINKKKVTWVNKEVAAATTASGQQATAVIGLGNSFTHVALIHLAEQSSGPS